MKRYYVAISLEAEEDIRRLFVYISSVQKAPLTANRYKKGVKKTILGLSVYGGSIAVCANEYIQSRYGPGVRRTNYKKVAIFFVIEGDVVYVKRVMAAGLVR
jgi:plasmid stabilization system protein ParE